MLIDLYGRERHPEYTNSEAFDEETYAGRRDRAELMLKTFSYIENGIPPENHIILIDADPINLIDRIGSTVTVATQLMGGGPQLGLLIDLNGKVIQYKHWERPEQHDEVLSHIFGVDPGL